MAQTPFWARKNSAPTIKIFAFNVKMKLLIFPSPKDAICRAVFPLSVLPLTAAPLLSSSGTRLTEPFLQARWRAVSFFYQGTEKRHQMPSIHLIESINRTVFNLWHWEDRTRIREDHRKQAITCPTEQLTREPVKAYLLNTWTKEQGPNIITV